MFLPIIIFKHLIWFCFSNFKGKNQMRYSYSVDIFLKTISIISSKVSIKFQSTDEFTCTEKLWLFARRIKISEKRRAATKKIFWFDIELINFENYVWSFQNSNDERKLKYTIERRRTMLRFFLVQSASVRFLILKKPNLSFARSRDMYLNSIVCISKII